MEIDSDQIHLLRQLAGVQAAYAPAGQAKAPTGHDGMDEQLDGGLACAQLHELYAAGPADTAGAAAMAALLALRIDGPVVWLREDQACRRLRLHAPGFAELGFDPARLLLGVLPDADAVLRAGADVLRCTGVGVAVIELWRNPRNLGLTTTRRFQLATEASGVTALMLRVEAEPSPSAAATRWAVRSIASRPLGANAPGHPAFELELLRHRGGGHGRWQVEWNADAGHFHDLAPPLSGAVVPVSANGPLAPVFPLRRSA